MNEYFFKFKDFSDILLLTNEEKKTNSILGTILLITFILPIGYYVLKQIIMNHKWEYVDDSFEIVEKQVVSKVSLL